MKAEELKHSAIFQALKKDKKVQEAAQRLGTTEDWLVIKQFVVGMKQVLMEAGFESNKLEEIARYRNLIRGMESIVLLPGLVKFVKKTEKEDKLKIEEAKKEAERRKFNPGAFIRRVAKKVKGGKNG